MQRSERSAYTPIDFRQWYAGGSLKISPKFQRRGVWNRAQRSFLIDTLLLELPVPPVYIRVVQSEDRTSVIREVIDGQQRLSAVLDYVENRYSLASKIESDCKGKRFSELDADQQNTILRYSLICEVFYGVEDSEVLRIFARLNTHSVKLNDQELRNGNFFGEFKQSCFALSFEHLEFWRKNKIFTEQNIARMQEAELTSELLIASLAGIQDKKKSISAFYEKYDEDYPERTTMEGRFRSVLDVINIVSPDDLSLTEFRRTPLFYSLYIAIYHRLYRLPRSELPTPANSQLTKNEYEGLQNGITTLSQVVQEAKEGSPVLESRATFITACLRQTDNFASSAD